MATNRVGDLTIEELRAIIREEIRQRVDQGGKQKDQPFIYSDLSDFPVDSYGSWPDDLSLRREDMYGDDER